MHSLSLPVQVLREGAIIPRYAHPGDAGMDLHAYDGATIEPHQRVLMPTGISVAIPDGYAGLVLPRSGNAIRHGLSLPNTPGLIDSGYRGELMVALVNLDAAETVCIEPGDRIAQLVLVPVVSATPVLVGSLDETSRGEGGFGSSGR